LCLVDSISYTIFQQLTEQFEGSIQVEQKLKNLQLYLSDIGDGLYRDLSAALKVAKSRPVAIFVSLDQERFDLPQFKSRRDGVAEVNKDGAVLFRARETSEKVLMSAGLTKMTRVASGHMGDVGHDAILFRETADTGLDLGMFASLRYVGSSFILKPFAIWW
jgi:hypothetical protein